MPEQSGADLSKLRIHREAPAHEPEKPGVRRAVLLYAIGAIVVLLVVAFLIRTLTGEVPQVETVTASFVSPSMSRAVLTASGYVVAQRKAAIASKATGRIVALYFREGDKVKKGDIIAKIESADVEAALEQARAELAVARSSVFDARRTFERSDTLLRRDLISQAEYDAAKARYDGAEAGVRSREASLKAAAVDVENTNIRAPFDGTVLTKNADVGEVVAPFAAGASTRVAVVTIADMGSLQVEVDVSEANIPNVTIGQPVEITLDAYPERGYRGVVDKIVPTADRAKATVMTKVRFLAKDERVLPEMGAKAHFLTGSGEDSSPEGSSFLAVDSRALVRSEGGVSLFVVEGSSAREVTVTTGRSAGALTEITGGIGPGTKVIVNPPETLSDGARVKFKE